MIKIRISINMKSKCPLSQNGSNNILNPKDNYFGTFLSYIKMDRY